MDGDNLVPPRVIYRLLNVHPNTLRRWAKMDLVKAYRNGPESTRFYDLDDLKAYLERCGEKAPGAYPTE